MVETKRTSSTGDMAIRSEAGGRIVAGSARDVGGAATPESKQRIPTMRMLASLVVNGILRLPAGYRRGMFLDVVV